MSLRFVLPFRGGGSNESASPLITPERAALTQPFGGGEYYDAVRRGRVFVGNMAAAGAVLPIFSNTAQVCGIWNPKGSGVNVVPVRLALTYVDTTGAAGGFCLGWVKDAPAQVAASTNITAFTDGTDGTTVMNCLLGGGYTRKAKFTPSAATVTAPIILRQLGLNQLVLTATDATNAQWKADYEFHGDLVIAPGNAVFIAGNIATLAKFAASLVWAEENE